MSCDSAIILLCVLLKKKFHTSSASPVISPFSPIQLCATLWTVVCHALLSMGFSRQEYWSGLPFPSSGERPNPGIEPACLTFPALAGRVPYHQRHLRSSVCRWADRFTFLCLSLLVYQRETVALRTHQKMVRIKTTHAQCLHRAANSKCSANSNQIPTTSPM